MRGSLTCLLLLLVPLHQCEKASGDNVIQFEDDHLRMALVELGIDTNGDGQISPGEAAEVTSLNIASNNFEWGFGWEIESLDGIEAFVNLKELICWGNRLTEIDLSVFPFLVRVNCGRNNLLQLDVSGNSELKFLSCGPNKLSTLDISENTVLTNLHCYYNELSTLDLSKNILLDTLSCGANHLSSIDVSKILR